MRHLPILLLLLLVSGCAVQAPPAPVAVELPDHTVNYLAEVKPILDSRCVVCHSCYNSPCQLKLSSYEGLDRGATKKRIYNATRLKTMDPTRLFIDAQTTAGWRDRGFTSVTASTADAGLNNSLLLQLLSHKMEHPASSGEYHAEAEDLTCAEDTAQLGGYLKKHPNGGMPFGFPPLKKEEFRLIAGWLAQGAHGPAPEQMAALTTPPPADRAWIGRWEEFLNRADAKHAVTARYLYEHLFLAHITFDSNSTTFYELVRSRTPPGKPLDLVATVRPYDDPGVERVFYRFRRIHSTIVHKTHMVVVLDKEEMTRIEKLFLEPDWLEKPHQVGYDPQVSANPFRAFAQIPPRSRYQYLLAHAHYVIMTFIRGPVCKGQVALNVIPDHFWVMFLDPDHDLSLRFPAFLRQQQDNLRMPTERGSDFPVFKLLDNPYHKAVQKFFQARQDFYASHFFTTPGYDAIWPGERAEDAPLLTVYRHFDSASVHRGLLGELPRTMWVIDYPLFERIYYALVAGFDVYGTLGHQLAVRLYMDTLRVEGETYFLDFLPADRRRELMSSWYRGMKYKDIHTFQSPLPAGISFRSDEPKREFIEQLVKRHILASTKIGFDPVNYLPAGATRPPLPAQYTDTEDLLQGLRAVSRPGTAFVRLFNNYSTNLAFLRVRMPDRRDLVATLVVNRWHDNVSYLFGENKVLDAARDRLDVLPGFIGSYPNYLFDVTLEQLPDLLDLFENMKDSPEDHARLHRYSVNRADSDFWERFDWFQQRFLKDEPVRGGLFDLNRYYPKAL